MQEAGFPDVGTIAWQAMFAPAGTAREVLDVLQKASIQAMQVPAAKKVFAEQNFNIVAHQVGGGGQALAGAGKSPLGARSPKR